MTTDTISSGHRIIPIGQAPRRFTAGRVCAEPECTKKLSTYNRSETCFGHSPIRFPRTRGRTITA